MYVDYEILKILKESKDSLSGTDLLDRLGMKEAVFKKRLLMQMATDNLVRFSDCSNSLSSVCSITELGTIRFLELQREHKKRLGSIVHAVLNSVIALCALIVSIIALCL